MIPYIFYREQAVFLIFVSFFRCDFGKRESEFFMFSDEVYTEDCTFMEEVDVYPEYSSDKELPDFTNMKIVPFDREIIAGTAWVGAHAVIPENGNSFNLPETDDFGRKANVSVKINSNGTGIMNYYDEYKEFKCHCDSKYSMCIEMSDETASGTLHTENLEGENPLWLLLNIGETAYWMHLDGTASWG